MAFTMYTQRLGGYLNQLQNPGGEVGTAPWVVFGTGVTLGRSTAQAKVGAASLAVTTTTTNSGIFTDFRAGWRANTRIGYGTWIKGDANTIGERIRTVLYDGGQAPALVSTVLDGTWQWVWGETVPAAASSVAFYVDNFGQTGPAIGTYYVDGAVLVSGAPAGYTSDPANFTPAGWLGATDNDRSTSIAGAISAENKVWNPSAESNTTGVTVNGTGTVTRVNSNATSGSWAFYYSGGSGASKGIIFWASANSLRHHVTAGRTYSFSADVTVVQGSSQGINAAIEWYNAAGGLISSTQGTLSSANGRRTASGTAPANAAYAITRVYSGGTATGNVEFYADSALFCDGSNTTYFDGSSGPGYEWLGVTHNSPSVKWTRHPSAPDRISLTLSDKTSPAYTPTAGVWTFPDEVERIRAEKPYIFDGLTTDISQIAV